MTAPLVVCVSANPAVDTRLRFHSFARGRINRAYSVEPFAGGKAAHVAMAAEALRAETVWLGFLGGATGQEFQEHFRGLRIELAGIAARNPTRRNLELLEDTGNVTEILEPGARPSEDELRQMLRTLAIGLRDKWRGALVVISGSLPTGAPESLYRSLIAAAKSGGSRVFLDTSGEALGTSLSARPDFAKPNREEAEAVLGRRLKSRDAVLKAANELIERGAASAALSLGPDGLVWVERRNGPAWFARAPRIKAISTVGCGDATVAGFALATAKGLEGEAAIRLAAACGAANCLAKSPGRISRTQVNSFITRVEVRRIG